MREDKIRDVRSACTAFLATAYTRDRRHCSSNSSTCILNVETTGGTVHDSRVQIFETSLTGT